MFPINNNILQQFQQFYNQIKGRDPNQILKELLTSGKVTQDQVDQARKMAEQFRGFFK